MTDAELYDSLYREIQEMRSAVVDALRDLEFRQRQLERKIEEIRNDIQSKRDIYKC